MFRCLIQLPDVGGYLPSERVERGETLFASYASEKREGHMPTVQITPEIGYVRLNGRIRIANGGVGADVRDG